MWVSPKARGQGVGDRLIGVAQDWAVRTRATILQLAVVPGNEHTIALYRRNGFADTGERGDLTPDGQPEHLMSKAIGAT